jgi:hypothetical protein
MADEKVDSSSAKPTKPKSLLDLSLKKAVSQFLSLDYLDLERTSLGPNLQKLLFRSLRTEIARLQEIENDWTRLERFCPLIDRKIYWKANKIKEPRLRGLTGTFKKKWSYIEEGDGGRQTTQEPEEPEMHWDHFSRELLLFSYQISSQLLLYRLTILFGMPPVETDGYKMCWEAKLRYSDGVSILTFRDWKGAANVYFSGSAEASTEALQLVKYLISINCRHTYDGIRAGTAA